MDDENEDFTFDIKVPALQRFLEFKESVIGNRLRRDQTRDS